MFSTAGRDKCSHIIVFKIRDHSHRSTGYASNVKICLVRKSSDGLNEQDNLEDDPRSRQLLPARKPKTVAKVRQLVDTGFRNTIKIEGKINGKLAGRRFVTTVLKIWETDSSA